MLGGGWRKNGALAGERVYISHTPSVPLIFKTLLLDILLFFKTLFAYSFLTFSLRVRPQDSAWNANICFVVLA